jgi:hypothetical protein
VSVTKAACDTVCEVGVQHGLIAGGWNQHRWAEAQATRSQVLRECCEGVCEAQLRVGCRQQGAYSKPGQARTCCPGRLLRLGLPH